MLGLKVGMTQVYDEHGKINPVTVLQVGPNPVLQVKTKGTKEDGSAKVGEGDGYFAVQVGFVNRSATRRRGRSAGTCRRRWSRSAASRAATPA
jgi:large subunit ribosomal protein L3